MTITWKTDHCGEGQSGRHYSITDGHAWEFIPSDGSTPRTGVSLRLHASGGGAPSRYSFHETLTDAHTEALADSNKDPHCW